MEININKLAIQNPWWEGEALEYDPVLEEYDLKEMKWEWQIFSEDELFGDKICFVQGCRGLGKTTLFKNSIRYLIRRQNIPGERIFYYSCYNLSGSEELNETIKTFIQDGRPKGRKERLFIFLDEVVMVPEWQHGLRRLQETGMLKNVTVICSGSLEDRVLGAGMVSKSIQPLSFRQFVFLSGGEDLAKKGSAKSLEYYLDAYFLTGGFPSAINDFCINNTVRQKIYDDLLYWLIADITFAGRDMFLARQILDNLVCWAGKPTGYKTLARNTKAKTHLTVREYMGIFERMFGIRILYQADDRGEPAASKAKKVYFEDPFLFWLFYCYTHNSLHYWRFARQSLHRHDVFEFLIEQVIFNHLTKLKGRIRLTYRRNVYRQEEVDFVVSSSRKTVPVMLAGRNRDISRCREILKKAGFRRGVIIGEEKNMDAKIKTVPLLDFLLGFEKYFE
jgi:hypothetical protein